VAKPATPAEPPTRHEPWRISLCVALVVTSVFTQLLREWVGREGVAVRESDYRNPAFDGFVLATHRSVLGWTKAVFVVVAITALIWLVWQYQAHRELRMLAPRARFSPATAMVAWVIPVVNLLAPCGAHEELMLRGDPEEGAAGAGRRIWPASFVVLWWLLFLASVAIVVAAMVAPPIDAGTRLGWVHGDRMLARAMWIPIAGALIGALMVFWIDVRLSRKRGRAESGYRQGIWVKENMGASAEGSADAP